MTDERPTLDRRDSQRQSARVANYAPPELVTSIAERLRTVCGDFPDTEFRTLVEKIAHVQWKYDQRRDAEALGIDRR
jgi:hypothetical protein